MDVDCVYSDAAGISKLGRVALPMMHKVTRSDGTSVWENVQTGRTWGVTGDEEHLPTDDFGSWHTSGHAMMSVVLQGSWEVETGSGERRVLELGSLTVFLDKDGQGHRSRTVSTDPSIVVGIGVDETTERFFHEQLGLV